MRPGTATRGPVSGEPTTATRGFATGSATWAAVGDPLVGGADAAGNGIEGAVLGVADDRDRRVRYWIRQWQWARGEPEDAQDRDVIARVEGDGLGVERLSRERGHRRGVLAGDDMRCGHDQSGASDPAGALDAKTARRPEHAHDAGRRAAHTRLLEHARVGRLGRHRWPRE